MSSFVTDPNSVSILVGSTSWQAWQTIRITRGIEVMPGTFELTGTDPYPDDGTRIIFAPGMPCTILIGSDPVITGYIDNVEFNTTPNSHEMRIVGRGMCEDLVDSSAKFQTATFERNNFTMGGLAQALCQQFGITVSLPDGDTPPVPQFNIILEETPVEILDRVGAYFAKLIYEDGYGHLVIGNVGVLHAASGFQQGVNVQAMSVSFGTENRYTEIDPLLTSTTVLVDGNAGDPVQIPWVQNARAYDKSFPPRADGQPRYRPLLQVVDTNILSQNLAAAHTSWDVWRRWGRSQRATVTCDSWRDSGGTLWTPNTLAPVTLPACKLQATWLITEVEFRKDGQSGTTALVTLMPPQAFQVEPTVLVPYEWQIQDALGGPNGAQTAGPQASG